MNGGFGLFSMRERIDLLGGELSINSEKGKGTRLNIVIPFIQDEEVTNEH
jgi:two-component system, NarL family, sensor histidine kinase DegS